MKKRRLFGCVKAATQRTEFDYAGVFLNHKELKERQSVYISKDVHSTISRLVHLFAIAGKTVSVGGLIDNILSEHLKSHKEHIAELYQKQLKNL